MSSRPPHIVKAHIPVQYGIKGLISSARSCDRCGKFHPNTNLTSGKVAGYPRFKTVCGDCKTLRIEKLKLKEQTS